jgi:hypothetical protein
LFVAVAVSVDDRLSTVTKFAVGFNVAWHVVMMITINVIQVQTILKPDPSVTGYRAGPPKLPVYVLTKVLFVNGNTRQNFALFASISTTGAFRLE